MNHRNNRRSEATKNKIKQSLIQMLYNCALNKITVQALCELASINRSTFYNHYDSPTSVLESIEKDFIAGLDKHMEGYDTTNPSIENLQTILTRILEYLQAQKNICFLMQTTSLEPFFKRSIYNNVFKSYLLTYPGFEKYTGDSLSYAQTFLLYGYGHCIDKWLHDGCEDSPQHLAALLAGYINRF